LDDWILLALTAKPSAPTLSVTESDLKRLLLCKYTRAAAHKIKMISVPIAT
jgi:hypothetical protein